MMQASPTNNENEFVFYFPGCSMAESRLELVPQSPPLIKPGRLEALLEKYLTFTLPRAHNMDRWLKRTLTDASWVSSRSVWILQMLITIDSFVTEERRKIWWQWAT